MPYADMFISPAPSKNCRHIFGQFDFQEFTVFFGESPPLTLRWRTVEAFENQPFTSFFR